MAYGPDTTSRLIIVPQYPTKLRYQEWWFTELPKHLSKYFNEVVVLGKSVENNSMSLKGYFAPIELSVLYETQQIQEYMALELKSNDALLLCDLSFPGLFSTVLAHKRPDKMFAICHGTSKNRYDYFSSIRPAKWRIETGLAKLFNAVFVASNYHAAKLGWDNIIVTPFPLPPMELFPTMEKSRKVISVARTGIQKRNAKLEARVTREVGNIEYPNAQSWEEYYQFIGTAEKMLITSREETYGYQVIDAILNDCIPIAPRKLSYPELLPDLYLYSTPEECINKLKANLPDPEFLLEQQANDFYRSISDTIMKSTKVS